MKHTPEHRKELDYTPKATAVCLCAGERASTHPVILVTGVHGHSLLGPAGWRGRCRRRPGFGTLRPRGGGRLPSVSSSSLGGGRHAHFQGGCVRSG